VLAPNFAHAAALAIDKQTNVPVIIAGGDKSAVFTLQIANNGNTDAFDLYSLVGITLTPKTLTLEAGKKTEVRVEASPNKRLRKSTRGFVIFDYELYSPLNGVTNDKLIFKLVDLSDVFDIRISSVKPGDENAVLTIQNRENATFSDVSFMFRSSLLEGEETLSFKPYEKINVSILIDRETMKSLLAGTYEVNTKISHESVSESVVIESKYLEQSGLSVSENSEGFIIRKTLSQKTNEGNIPTEAIIALRQNIVTRLITQLAPEPTNVTKEGFFVTYTWAKQLAPSESLQVNSTTNYTMPFTILIVILIIVFFVKFYTMTNVVVTKNVSPVHTKGGEFALKIRVHVKARKNVENLILTDRIPHAMKLYGHFPVKPEMIDENTRRIVWKLPRLHAGEERVFSYVIYSKIRVVGAFELPLAHASFTREDKHLQVNSNKTTFASELSREED